ncbi:unnamed protein product [Cuscuta campestris]|uniref:ATP-dependent DNA helicase n=1 Tax=Cuscuta campestris TaxID=132261 RepID=A0A484LAY0_9ASTE|nr:unnamed protein product [Cuscuta campestris]
MPCKSHRSSCMTFLLQDSVFHFSLKSGYVWLIMSEVWSVFSITQCSSEGTATDSEADTESRYGVDVDQALEWGKQVSILACVLHDALPKENVKGHVVNVASEFKQSYCRCYIPTVSCSTRKDGLPIVGAYERNNSKAKNSPPTFSLCCMEGRVSLSALKTAPQYLRNLLSHNGGKRSATFRENIRAYNSILAFTSIGAQIDYEINKTKGPYVFRISGQNCHQIGSLNPQPGKPRKFLQLYMYDNKTEEVCSRIKSLTKDKPNSKLDETILSDLITMLDRENCLAKTFRMARDRMKESEDVQLQLHLLSERTPKQRQYNAPTASEVAALIVGDFGQAPDGRNIVVEHKTKGLQEINERHPALMALQYPLLFPHGEDGYHEKILYTDSPRMQVSRACVTMREYYAYRMQQRLTEGEQLLTLKDTQNIAEVVNDDTAQQTMFTQWLERNSHDAEARALTYAEFPMCYALGLLSDEKEWIEAIQEANEWATANQARELFVTILLFCEVSDPNQFWENTKNILQDDILHRRRKMYRHPDLHLTPTQIQTYCLLELDKILQRFGKTLSDFQSLPQPSFSEISSLDNRMIREELSYNITELQALHTQNMTLLNGEQLKAYNAVIAAVETGQGGVFFVYGHGGTGKTFLYSTIAAKIRSERKVVLTVASSGM